MVDPYDPLHPDGPADPDDLPTPRTDLGHWWPLATHNIAEPAGETVVLEPFVGGRWYERSSAGGETDWGRVLAFDPPHRILLSWLMGSDWKHEPDPTRASEIEVTFSGEDADRTRVVFEHRHLERYRDRAGRMRAILDRPNGAEGVLRAFGIAFAAQRRGPRSETRTRREPRQ